jgi:hypothetical protein
LRFGLPRAEQGKSGKIIKGGFISSVRVSREARPLFTTAWFPYLASSLEMRCIKREDEFIFAFFIFSDAPLDHFLAANTHVTGC